MENWKHIGGLLTGIAALMTAAIPIFSYLNDTNKQNAIKINELKELKKQYALINDPDGWVNLRVAPNVTSEVIRKIENGYRVEILDRQGNWAKIKTSIDEIGFVYYNRLNYEN
jgi:uncharacterized protein YgiM (DUF1202 family)